MSIRTDRHDLRLDDALARPVRMVGPGEHGGAILEAVTAVLTDLPYPSGLERVAPEALSTRLDEWVGRPVVLQGPAHTARALAADPTIQGREAIGIITGARYDAAAGERIMTFSVPDPANVEKIATRYPATSEAYRATTREPTAEERAAGVVAVQVDRLPLSLALVDRGRAGPRARVRTDGADDMPTMTPDEIKALAEALVPMLMAAMKPASEEPTGEIAPAADMAEMEKVKADRDAQRARADAAEARLLKTDAAEIAADLARLRVTCDGFDAAAPTAESVAKARAMRDAAALAHIRADRIDDGPQGQRPDARPTARDQKLNEPLIPASRYGRGKEC